MTETQHPAPTDHEVVSASENEERTLALERLVAELTAELEERNAELTVINRVQQGLVAELDIQAIYDLVGDTIQAIFDAQHVHITAADLDSDTYRFVYVIENGQRIRIPEQFPTDDFGRRLMRRPQEDNAVNQKLAIRLLAQMGYPANVAGNGIEAVQAVERQRYDAVLMDVQMPEMDGLEATREICARWPGTSRPYIIAVTANATDEDRRRCLEAGMDNYVSKPIRVDELVAALGRAGAAAKHPRPLESQDHPGIDRVVLDELAVATDVAFVCELIDAFLEESPGYLRTMREGLANSDADPIRRAAHTLKSTAATLGALVLSDQAREVEARTRAGQLAGLEGSIEALDERYQRAEQAMKAWRDGK